MLFQDPGKNRKTLLYSFMIIYSDCTYGFESGDHIDHINMYYSHARTTYDIADPIPLSDRSIPMVELRTVETEYLGFPFTECKDAVFTPVSNLCHKYCTNVFFCPEINDAKFVDF